MKLPLDSESIRIGIIGLGYVGLPLAVEFGKKFDTLGYDIDAGRIEELKAGRDRTHEISASDLSDAKLLAFSAAKSDLGDRTVFIVTVPTPVDADKRPDFSPLVSASRTIGAFLKRGNTVIYESTVYPGATEEVCIPQLERMSDLKLNLDFYVGYSPERINPGDKLRRLASIPKITSGSSPAAADFVDALYRTIITAGTHKAASLKVAEAAKVIENTQRDANIALINEFALIFGRLGIDTNDVLEAAGTKWNFLPFKPGLVGGHCIGVDPYYLIQKAQSVGYYPDILLACRRINDAMGKHVAAEVIKLMIHRGTAIKGSRVLVLGFTFKENCPDLRNTRVIDLVREFEAFGTVVDVYDPWADSTHAMREYGIQLLPTTPTKGVFDAVVLAVSHAEFVQVEPAAIRAFGNHHSVVFDIKGALPREHVDGRL